MKIVFRSLEDKEEDYKKLYLWCQNKEVYEWFEQRKLSFEEIKKKYQKKLKEKIQKLYYITYDDKEIGFVQIYPYEKDKEIFEFDIFIGEKDYLNKGIGTEVIHQITENIIEKENAKGIILRPFKRNERAINCYKKCNYKIIMEEDGLDTLGNPEKIVVLYYDGKNEK